MKPEDSSCRQLCRGLARVQGPCTCTPTTPTSRFLDTKRENADEKIRIKTLSLGVVIPDITFELAQTRTCFFSPYDVERVYGMPFVDINVTEKYREMVDDGRIKKKKINARTFFQTLAEIQFESATPYVMFEDDGQQGQLIKGKVVMSNLCPRSSRSPSLRAQ